MCGKAIGEEDVETAVDEHRDKVLVKTHDCPEDVCACTSACVPDRSWFACAHTRAAMSTRSAMRSKKTRHA